MTLKHVTLGNLEEEKCGINDLYYISMMLVLSSRYSKNKLEKILIMGIYNLSMGLVGPLGLRSHAKRFILECGGETVFPRFGRDLCVRGGKGGQGKLTRFSTRI